MGKQHLLDRSAVSTLVYAMSRNTNNIIKALNTFSQSIYWIRTTRFRTDSEDRLFRFYSACEAFNTVLSDVASADLIRGVRVNNIFAALDDVRTSTRGDELLAPHKATLTAVAGWVRPAMSRVLSDIEWAMTNGFCVVMLPDIESPSVHEVTVSNMAQRIDMLRYKLRPMANLLGLGDDRAFWWMRLREKREFVGLTQADPVIDEAIPFFVSDMGHEWLEGIASVVLTDAFRESSHMAQRRMLATVGGALAEALQVPDYISYRTTSLSSTKVMFMQLWATWFRHYQPHMTIIRDLAEVISE